MLVRGGDFDVAVLDVVVPQGSGLDVLAAIRASARPARVLMLTARGETADRIEGLDRGADDYLVKPFAFAELVARLRALIRRSEARVTELRVGSLRIDLLGHSAFAGAKRIDLTPIEFSLLAALARGAGEPHDRSALLREVWGYDFDPGTNVVEVHVNRLRRKLEDAGAASVLKTVRGRGYCLA
jgi:two-component system OmpR family response regulator